MGQQKQTSSPPTPDCIRGQGREEQEEGPELPVEQLPTPLFSLLQPPPPRVPGPASDTPSVSALSAVHGIKWTCSNGNSSSGFSVEQLVQQILDSHQTKPQPRTHNCLCTGSLGEPSGAGGSWAHTSDPAGERGKGGTTAPIALHASSGEGQRFWRNGFFH